jgi:glycosyltransferase
MNRNVYIINNQSSRASVYGIGTYVNELIQGLAVRNVRVHLIHLNAGQHKVVVENTDAVEHIYIPTPKIRYKDEMKHNQLYFQNAVYLLRQYIDNSDRVIFHLNYTQSKSLSDALKKTFNCSVVLALHYLTWGFELLGNATRLRKILAEDEFGLNDSAEKTSYRSFHEEKSFFETVDRVICLSEHTACLLKQDYRIDECRLAVVYNGLTDAAGEQSDRMQLRKKYGLPNNAPVILFVGRLDAVKGLSYFIEAVKILLDRLPACHVLIAGSGDYGIYLKSCGNRWMNVHFTGLLDKGDLYELYAVADIGVMPSLHEQCSYVAIEMMMHGVPLVGSTSTGLCEMIEEGVTGLHVPVEEFSDRVEIDAELLAEKMLYLLLHPEERERMGRNARRRYEDVYSSEVMGEKMTTFYDDLNTLSGLTLNIWEI